MKAYLTVTESPDLSEKCELLHEKYLLLIKIFIDARTIHSKKYY